MRNVFFIVLKEVPYGTSFFCILVSQSRLSTKRRFVRVVCALALSHQLTNTSFRTSLSRFFLSLHAGSKPILECRKTFERTSFFVNKIRHQKQAVRLSFGFSSPHVPKYALIQNGHSESFGVCVIAEGNRIGAESPSMAACPASRTSRFSPVLRMLLRTYFAFKRRTLD